MTEVLDVGVGEAASAGVVACVVMTLLYARAFDLRSRGEGLEVGVYQLKSTRKPQ